MSKKFLLLILLCLFTFSCNLIQQTDSIDESKNENRSKVMEVKKNFKQNNRNYLVNLYRAYKTCDHFYTTDYNEIAASSGNYVFERIECRVSSAYTGDTVPLYRLCLEDRNGDAEDHLYTTSINEKNKLIRRGWRDEGVECFVWATNVSGTIPLYRYSRKGNHFYTTDYGNYNGYKYEGIQCYVFSR